MAVINSAIGTHTGSNSNKDVEIIHANKKIINYFPRGLAKVFPNLSGINMCCNGLKELNQEDLKSFTNLNSLNLEKNEIEILEDGVFAYNLDLTIVDLDSNKLLHIDYNAFVNLTKLTFLGLSLNPCVNITGKTKSAIDEIITTVKSQCVISEFITLKNLEEEFKSISVNTQPEFEVKVQELVVNFRLSRLSGNKVIKQRIDALTEWKFQALWSFKEQLKALENSNAETMRIVKKQGDEIDAMSFKYTWMLALSIFNGIIVIVMIIAMRNRIET